MLDSGPGDSTLFDGTAGSPPLVLDQELHSELLSWDDDPFGIDPDQTTEFLTS